MDVIERLMYFNLTRHEATLYMALLAEGKLTGYEAAKLTGISRSNTYTALAGLVDKGAAHVIEDTATRYTPVHIEEFCDNKIRQMQEYKLFLLEKMPVAKNEVEGYITIKGAHAVMNKLTNMIAKAEARVYVSATAAIIEQLRPQLEDAVRRGLKVVIITGRRLLLKGATVYHADEPSRQIRLIADSGKVLTGDFADGEASTCLYSGKQNLVELFKDALKNEIKLIELTKRK